MANLFTRIRDLYGQVGKEQEYEREIALSRDLNELLNEFADERRRRALKSKAAPPDRPPAKALAA